MSTTTAALAALALLYAACACLALAMDRHFEQATGSEAVPPRLRRALRLCALLLAAAALAACLQPWGAAVATVVWSGMLSCGALLAALTLSLAPRRLGGLALCATAAGLGLPWIEAGAMRFL